MWFGGFFCGSAALPVILPSDNSTETPETTSMARTTIQPAPTTISPVNCLKDGDLINFQKSIETQIIQNFEKVMSEMGKNNGGNAGGGKGKSTEIPQKIVDHTSQFNTVNNNIQKLQNTVDTSVQSMADKMSEMSENMEKVTNKLESMEKKNQNLVSKINSMSERFESKFSGISSSVSALSEQLSKMQEASANAWSSFNRTSVIPPGKNQESCKCEERKCECNCKYEGNSNQKPVVVDPATIKIDLPKDHWLWERLIEIETKVCYAINELHYLRNVKNDKRIENKSYDVRSHHDSMNDRQVIVEKSDHEQHRANNIEMIHHRAAIASRKRRNLN